VTPATPDAGRAKHSCDSGNRSVRSKESTIEVFAVQKVIADQRWSDRGRFAKSGLIGRSLLIGDQIGGDRPSLLSRRSLCHRRSLFSSRIHFASFLVFMDSMQQHVQSNFREIGFFVKPKPFGSIHVDRHPSVTTCGNTPSIRSPVAHRRSDTAGRRSLSDRRSEMSRSITPYRTPDQTISDRRSGMA
jgi:hypothetical protein